jgi:hypothetical protein
MLRSMRCGFSYDLSKTALQNTVPIKRDAAEDYDLKKTYPAISLDAFYENLTSFTLTDAEAMQYMTFAAKMARIRFASDAEMLSLKADFQCALAFIGKLEEVDVKGQEPLGNVLEYYGGNGLKMRSSAELDQIV